MTYGDLFFLLPCLSCSWAYCLLYRTPFSFFYHAIPFVLSFVDLGTLFGPSTSLIPISEDFMVLGPLSKTSPLHLALLCIIQSRRCGYEQSRNLLGQPFLISVDFQVDELVFIGDANSSSSLIVFVLWELHLQWLRGVFVWPWSFMALRDTVGRPPLIDDVCWYEDARHDVVTSLLIFLNDYWRTLQAHRTIA